MLNEIGWTTGPGAPSRVSVESVANEMCTVARVWSTPGTVATTALPTHMTRVIIGVRGSAEIRSGTEACSLGEQQLILVEGEREITAQSESSWARCEWQLSSPALRQARFAAHFLRVLTLRPEHYALLLSMTNAMSTSQGIERGVNTGLLTDALSGVIVASALEAAGSSAALSPVQHSIVEQAVDVIEQRHTEPGLDITSLADELRITPRHLRRVFAATGRSPREALEARRVDTALSILSINPGRYRRHREEAALAAGFSSLRQLDDALHRHRA